jgi:hypothetical protein
LQQLQQRYLELLEQARDLQRNGDIRGFAERTAEAESVGRELDRLGQQPDSAAPTPP